MAKSTSNKSKIEARLLDSLRTATKTKVAVVAPKDSARLAA